MTTAKLGRKKEHRERTLRNLATSLVLFEKVRTTEAKAKAVLPTVERLISQAIGGSLAARRQAKAVLFDPNAVSKLYEDVATRRGERTSGFVRLTKLPVRPGDGAAMAQLEILYKPLEEVLGEQSKTKVQVRKAAKKAEETETQPAEEATESAAKSEE